MKRFLLWLLGIIVGLLLLVYVLLFSPIGNTIFKPILQSQINKHSPIPLQLEQFSLGLGNLDILLENNPKMTIKLKGAYNPLLLKVDMALNVDVSDISIFGDIVGVPLGGSFSIDTTLQGKIFDKLEIRTISDIAKSSTKIEAVSENLTLQFINANIQNLHLDEILTMAGKKPYISGLLHLTGTITNQDAQSLNGNILLSITQGSFSQQYIKQDFDIQTPKTSFTLNLKGIFQNNALQHNLNFDSNIGKITSTGKTLLYSLSTQSSYNISLNDLGAFTPFVGVKIRGDFKTNGSIEGDKKNMKISGKSNIAESNTTYDVLLANLGLQEISFDINNLKVEKLLYMLYQPQYISGIEIAQGRIWDFDNGISAQVSQSFKGNTNNAPIKKAFNLDMPNTPFSYTTKATLNKGSGETNMVLDSSLAKIIMPKIAINLNKNSINAPYEIILPNLKKLYFLTGISLTGDIKANGNIDMQNKAFRADFHTKSLGGNIKASFDGENLKADIAKLDVISLLKILQYPQIFSAKMNGNLAYNTTTQIGTLNATLSNGKFLKNILTDMLLAYFKFDATGLIFNDIKLKSDIDKQMLTSSLDMKSKDFSLSGDNILINLEQDTIKAQLKAAIKNNHIGIRLNGDLNAPQVEFDITDIIKQQASKAIKQQLGNNLSKQAQDGLKKLKELFR